MYKAESSIIAIKLSKILLIQKLIVFVNSYHSFEKLIFIAYKVIGHKKSKTWQEIN